MTHVSPFLVFDEINAISLLTTGDAGTDHSSIAALAEFASVGIPRTKAKQQSRTTPPVTAAGATNPRCSIPAAVARTTRSAISDAVSSAGHDTVTRFRI